MQKTKNISEAEKAKEAIKKTLSRKFQWSADDVKIKKEKRKGD